MTKRGLASLGAAVALLVASAGCSAPGPLPVAEGHVHGEAGASPAGGSHGEDAMAAHMQEMKQSMGEVRAILDRTQNVSDPVQLRSALDGIRAQLEVMQDSMARCKEKMHGKKES